VLLRAAGLHRNLSFRPGPRARSSRDRRERLSSHDISARAAARDNACGATLQRYEERLARALAHVINILDPDVIVLGGGMSNIDRLYVSVPQLWKPGVLGSRGHKLVRHVHGDSSRGERGMAGRERVIVPVKLRSSG
jgi:predicted NBD/HSP70 family sugar kinase